MESIDSNTKLFPSSSNKIFYSLGISLVNEQQLLNYVQRDEHWQQQFRIRTISIENFIFVPNEIEDQKIQNEELHIIGCRCLANHKNDLIEIEKKYICFSVDIKDVEKAEDDEENTEFTQIYVPNEWKSCAKSICFAEFIGRQIFGEIYKFITMTCKPPLSADINSGIDILKFLIELFEHINKKNNNSDAKTTVEYGCNAEFLDIDLSNCNENSAYELELLGKLLSNYVQELNKWPIFYKRNFQPFFGTNKMEKQLRIAYTAIEPPELVFDACFKAPIKFKSFRFLYCFGNLTKFVEKLIQYFLYEKAEIVMPEAVIIELFESNVQSIGHWPPTFLSICDEQLSATANKTDQNQIQHKGGITMAVKEEWLQYSVLPNAKFLLHNESMKREFIMNIWFQSRDWTINPKKIHIYQTNCTNTDMGH